MRTLIEYRGQDSQVTKREISNIRREGDDAINAMCAVAGAVRTFKVSRIIRAVNPDTGEVIANPWVHFGMGLGVAGGPNPWAVVGLVLPVVRVLKFLAKRIRGFGKRERSAIAAFIGRRAAPPALPPDSLDRWLVDLWAGDATDHDADLALIPADLRADARAAALKIAGGSGRRPIDPDVMAIIDAALG